MREFLLALVLVAAIGGIFYYSNSGHVDAVITKWIEASE